MTLRDIERSVYRRLSKNASTPNPETRLRIQGFINERHKRLLADFPQFADEVLEFDSVAEQPDYSLPEQGIARVTRIWDPTNRIPLEQKDLAWYRLVDQDPQSGTPLAWVPLGYTQVHTQPSDASEVFVKSTSANDVNRCYIEGIIEGGYRRVAEVTMTGTTAVSVDTSITTWIEIDKFYLSEQAAGTVTLLEDSGSGTELSRIAIGDTYAKFSTFFLYPTPASEVTYAIDVKRNVGDMQNPTDEPLLPEEFHDLLAIGARLDEYEANDDSRRRIAEVEWDERYKALTSFVLAHPARTINLNGVYEPQRSALGSWYPAGT